MNRGDYEKQRQRIISQKRSLVMKIRQWRDRRPSYAAELQAKLDAIPTPKPLPKIYGYELLDSDGDYAGFTLDHNEAIASGLAVTKREANGISHLSV